MVVKKWIFTDGDNSQQCCLINKQPFTRGVAKSICSLKFHKIHREAPMSESLFNKDAGADLYTGISFAFCETLRSKFFTKNPRTISERRRENTKVI